MASERRLSIHKTAFATVEPKGKSAHLGKTGMVTVKFDPSKTGLQLDAYCVPKSGPGVIGAGIEIANAKATVLAAVAAKFG
jgi:hypothetical protein